MSTAEQRRGGLDEQLLLDLPGGGRALFTTRAYGNLSTGSGDELEHGMRRREQLCERFDLGWLCSSRQAHGTDVNVVRALSGSGGQPLAIDADGHATTVRGVGVMVMAADCLPIALGSGGAVAVVHAGWRGLSGGVLEHGVRALRDLAGATAPIGAIVGPGAGACCYEVGAEVHEAFRAERALATPTAASPASSPEGDGQRDDDSPRGHLDLRAIAHERLLAAGVSDVRHVDACTICDTRYFSHRREGARAGRQAVIAWLS
jgi:purine-nucleoside/S-methyl-5'-thioadenosine phosphorylase / adenosine deaminase